VEPARSDEYRPGDLPHDRLLKIKCAGEGHLRAIAFQPQVVNLCAAAVKEKRMQRFVSARRVPRRGLSSERRNGWNQKK